MKGFSFKKLSHSERTIFLFILQCSQKSHQCTLRSIIEYSNLSKSTILRNLKSLSERKIILAKKNTSTHGVCLPSTYITTEQLSQYQNDTAEQLSQYQNDTVDSSRAIDIYNIYNIYKKDLVNYIKLSKNSSEVIQNYSNTTLLRSISANKKEPISGEDKKMNPKNKKNLSWDPQRIAFYSLLFDFYDACNSILRVDFIKEETPLPEKILGRIPKTLELQTRELWRNYATERNLTFTGLKERIMQLASYIRSKKSFYFKDSISLHRLITQKNLFDTMISEAYENSIKKEKAIITEKINKTHEVKKDDEADMSIDISKLFKDLHEKFENSKNI